MNDLLKRADLFNSHSDSTSGKNPADAKLVADLADRIRHLETTSLSMSKRIAVGFFQWWWNTGGTNTYQGFDTYWQKLLMNELELPSEGAVESVPKKTGKEMVEGLQPVSPEAVPVVNDITNDYGRKRVTLENLQKSWLSGTTCHHQRRTVHWNSDDGQWVVMKHHGHSEWVGGWDGNSYCGTHYDLFRVGDVFPDRMGESPYFTQEGRWSKKSMEWVEKVMAGWRPDKFVETR